MVTAVPFGRTDAPATEPAPLAIPVASPHFAAAAREPGPPDAGQGRRPGGFCRSDSPSPEHGVQPRAAHAAQPAGGRRPGAGGVPRAVSQPARLESDAASSSRGCAAWPAIAASTRSGGGTIVRSSAPTRCPTRAITADCARCSSPNACRRWLPVCPSERGWWWCFGIRKRWTPTEIADALACR